MASLAPLRSGGEDYRYFTVGSVFAAVLEAYVD
jgi:hypothetical protein